MLIGSGIHCSHSHYKMKVVIHDRRYGEWGGEGKSGKDPQQNQALSIFPKHHWHNKLHGNNVTSCSEDKNILSVSLADCIVLSHLQSQSCCVSFSLVF